MTRFLLVLINYVLVLFLSEIWISYSRKERAISCKFCITQITTQNMNTTIYWKSIFSPQNTSIHYVLEYDGSGGLAKWLSIPCKHPQWHNSSGEMSCGLLTCETTNMDDYYEIRVRAYGNSSHFVTPSVVHNPFAENIPLRIIDVNITHNSSSSATINWILPRNFCKKSKYCVVFYYHRQESRINQSATVPSEDINSFRFLVTGLNPCSKYLFYLTVYHEDLCSFDPFSRWTTGPFILLPSNAVHYLAPAVRVWNFASTVLWRQPDSCTLKSTQFSVYYKIPEFHQSWSKSDCIIKKDAISNAFSCQFLTCAVTREQDYYVQVRVNGSIGRDENILYFSPALENIPAQIWNVNVSALTSTSLQVAWTLAPLFCSKFEYCLTFLYHGDNTENKSLAISEEQQKKLSIIVHNVLPYTNYYFYPITFRPGWGCPISPHPSHGATGPFTGTTLEDAPSKAPVLICSLCDVIVHDGKRTGIVRWQLPPKSKWNGVPRVFILQWRVNLTKSNVFPLTWNNKTITKSLATESNLTGLRSDLEYIVRVKMCNGALCSKFSKEMKIEKLKDKHSKPTTGTSSARTVVIIVVVILLLAALIVGGIILYRKVKKLRRLRAARNATSSSVQLPSLGYLSYDNITSASLPSYSQLSARDDCFSLEAEADELGKKSENSSQIEEDIPGDTTLPSVPIL